MEKYLAKEIDRSLGALIQVFSSIEEEKINVVPFEGSWTAGQLAQHMIMSNSGFDELINGPVESTERKPDALIEDIKSTFLDFSHKLESPDFVRPPKIEYNKDELLQSLNNIRKSFGKTLEADDLTKTCTGFKLPVLGYLTQLEAAHFVLYHTQRHIHQLKNIGARLETAKNSSIS